ncbi:outer membrane beta-barrel protein [Simiduia aestuariiviva]|uniref:Outer membrane protein beta-barrel domain-containing protein n=1 Tax=Simiduia aestuariiviva TaxID=1510459 RepID=A0A839UPV8_9GAMM|nr:outer membrane beta-barrel protein [Simiduia aestuariiviva]MBB3167415.1 hypothetical protein [Simiduia aestuariiviva]
MFKSLLAVGVIAATTMASQAQAEHRVNLDVSYLGGISSDYSEVGLSYDSELRMQGIKGAFYVPMGPYAFWQGSYDYSADTVFDDKTEITMGKVYAGGRLPLGDLFALKAYVGYASDEITDEDGVIEDSGTLYGVAADLSVAERFTLEAHYEQADLGDFTFNEYGVNGYWYFTPTIAVGGGYKYRDFELDTAADSFSLDFGYVEAGLRISF